jgi:hypothetical protein
MYKKKQNISFLEDKCSVHPYWMVYALSLTPLILIKWANSKTKHPHLCTYFLLCMHRTYP